MSISGSEVKSTLQEVTVKTLYAGSSPALSTIGIYLLTKCADLTTPSGKRRK